MKKIVIVAVAAASFFTAAGFSLSALYATPQVVVTPDPCLSGYKYTTEVRIYSFGPPLTLISLYTKGFQTQAEINAYLTNYNSTHTTTTMSINTICIKAVGGLQP